FVDRPRLVGPERADDDLHLAALDELLRLWQDLRLEAAGIGRDELGPAAGQRAVAVLEELGEAFFHLLAAGGKRTGVDGEEADFERLALCPGDSRQQARGRAEAKDGAPRQGSRAAGGNHRSCSLRLFRASTLGRRRKYIGKPGNWQVNAQTARRRR